MTKVFDDEAVARAFRDAARALAEGDPDTLAGRFSPRRPEPPAETPAQNPPLKHAAARR